MQELKEKMHKMEQQYKFMEKELKRAKRSREIAEKLIKEKINISV